MYSARSQSQNVQFISHFEIATLRSTCRSGCILMLRERRNHMRRGLRIAGMMAGILFGLIATAAAKDSIKLKNAKGESVGHAILYNGMHGVRIQYNLKNL